MRYVYLVRAGNNQYKIGVSRNVKKRVAALQTSNINLVEVVTAKRTSADSEYEKRLHRKVREFSGTGGKEWFHLTADQAIEIAIEINTAPDVDVAEDIIQDLKKEMTKIVDTYEQKIALEFQQIEAAKRALYEANQPEPQPHTILRQTKFETISREQLTLQRVKQQQEQEEDEYARAVQTIREHGHASTSFLQRKLRIGYGKAARLIERMEIEGIISPLDGIHRTVL